MTDEPYAGNLHVRVCGGPGRPTPRPTRTIISRHPRRPTFGGGAAVPEVCCGRYGETDDHERFLWQRINDGG